MTNYLHSHDILCFVTTQSFLDSMVDTTQYIAGLINLFKWLKLKPYQLNLKNILRWQSTTQLCTRGCQNEGKWYILHLIRITKPKFELQPQLAIKPEPLLESTFSKKDCHGPYFLFTSLMIDIIPVGTVPYMWILGHSPILGTHK